MSVIVQPLIPFEKLSDGMTQVSVVANDNARRAEVIALPVESFEATEPVSPSEGELVAMTDDWGIAFVDPDGDYVSADGVLAYYYDGAWSYWQPFLGMLKEIAGAPYEYDPDSASSWQPYSTAPAGITVTSHSAAYPIVLGDANTALLHPSADTTARTFTIPANASVAFPIGTVLTFINQNAAGVLSIAITSDTMRLAGAGTTGTRTLAANGMATAIKLTATEWLVSGTGLT